ncbi:MAG: plasmid maintenance system killer protein [Desulfobacula sp.]|nr:plasmid maintenance system killer protein [Desulfobacula sp.]MBT3484292.1 plasmid maintenance system killer protein [Desulfobacula sp.]MBT3805002.1 plasmid maintenance system killer protein [Desulfobacula sp.]MBT4024086.1 plasmid maintenance system killer protein [Desulfobacula sp.]MBT4197411.1 plasmid maintenance system killer protein [Desulfobacula sp.]
MINSFLNKGAEDIFNGKNTKDVRKTCPKNLWRIAARKLDQIDSIIKLEELRIPPGNQFESLSGDRKMEHSIRINNKYRICFIWKDGCANQVEITDYH